MDISYPTPTPGYSSLGNNNQRLPQKQSELHSLQSSGNSCLCLLSMTGEIVLAQPVSHNPTIQQLFMGGLLWTRPKRDSKQRHVCPPHKADEDG